MHALLGLDSMPLLAQEASATYLRYITGGGVVGYVILGLSVIAVALGLAQLVHVRAASLAPSSLMDDINTMASQGQFGRALERLKLADADCFAGRVLRYLTHSLKVPEDDKNRWYRHWVESGLEVVERQLAQQPTRFCHGDTPTIADCTLVPQIFNAKRFECRLAHVPEVMRVFDACMQLPAFENTRPEACPDAG